MIVVIDYGMGNLRSVQKSFNRLKIDAIISSKIDDIKNADKLVLPGVGHFYQGMENLKKRGIINILNEKVLEKKTPILGICLGMQLFTQFSEEGDSEGLGWIKAKTKKFNFEFKENSIKIPHMGWNTISINRSNSLLENNEYDPPFYFVHSYHVLCDNEQDILATSFYGYNFTSAINRDNIFGTQFHPEKSHKQGLKILANFKEKINV